MQKPSDLNVATHLINRFDENFDGLAKTLKRVVGEQVRTMKISHAQDLAMEVAKERVMHGESCIMVAQAHGIDSYKVRLELQMMTVNGPAKSRVMNGDSCRVVAKEHGIDDYLPSHPHRPLMRRHLHSPPDFLLG
jgi:hypothetical protein